MSIDNEPLMSDPAKAPLAHCTARANAKRGLNSYIPLSPSAFSI